MNSVDAILARHGTSRDAAIPVLQAIQAEHGYLPREALQQVSERSKMTLRQLYGVATFYERFRFTPVGKHLIRACHGTACHVNGAKSMSRTLEDILKIQDRETTRDGLFTLETVACLGCCSLAPVVMIDAETYGRLTPQSLRRILRTQLKRAREAGEARR